MTRSSRTNKRQQEHGFFTIWMMGLCAIVFLVGNVSEDFWHLLTERRDLAQIADSAAIAGATQIDLAQFQQSPSVLALDPDDATARATAYVNQAAAQDNLTLDPPEITVNAAGQLQITLSEKIDTLFTNLLNNGSNYIITVNSTAEPKLG